MCLISSVIVDRSVQLQPASVESKMFFPATATSVSGSPSSTAMSQMPTRLGASAFCDQVRPPSVE